MHRNHQISAFLGGTRWSSAHALFERIKAKGLLQDVVKADTKGALTEAVKYLPGNGIRRHQLIPGDNAIEGPERAVIRVNVDNITLDFVRIENVKSIAKGVCGGAMTSTGVGHENLNSIDIVYLGTFGR
jgi:hypothetical protein